MNFFKKIFSKRVGKENTLSSLFAEMRIPALRVLTYYISTSK